MKMELKLNDYAGLTSSEAPMRLSLSCLHHSNTNRRDGFQTMTPSPEQDMICRSMKALEEFTGWVDWNTHMRGGRRQLHKLIATALAALQGHVKLEHLTNPICIVS